MSLFFNSRFVWQASSPSSGGTSGAAPGIDASHSYNAAAKDTLEQFSREFEASMPERTKLALELRKNRLDTTSTKLAQAAVDAIKAALANVSPSHHGFTAALDLIRDGLNTDPATPAYQYALEQLNLTIGYITERSEAMDASAKALDTMQEGFSTHGFVDRAVARYERMSGTGKLVAMGSLAFGIYTIFKMRHLKRLAGVGLAAIAADQIVKFSSKDGKGIFDRVGISSAYQELPPEIKSHLKKHGIEGERFVTGSEAVLTEPVGNIIELHKGARNQSIAPSRLGMLETDDGMDGRELYKMIDGLVRDYDKEHGPGSFYLTYGNPENGALNPNAKLTMMQVLMSFKGDEMLDEFLSDREKDLIEGHYQTLFLSDPKKRFTMVGATTLQVNGLSVPNPIRRDDLNPSSFYEQYDRHIGTTDENPNPWFRVDFDGKAPIILKPQDPAHEIEAARNRIEANMKDYIESKFVGPLAGKAVEQTTRYTPKGVSTPWYRIDQHARNMAISYIDWATNNGSPPGSPPSATTPTEAQSLWIVKNVPVGRGFTADLIVGDGPGFDPDTPYLYFGDLALMPLADASNNVDFLGKIEEVIGNKIDFDASRLGRDVSLMSQIAFRPQGKYKLDDFTDYEVDGRYSKSGVKKYLLYSVAYGEHAALRNGVPESIAQGWGDAILDKANGSYLFHQAVNAIVDTKPIQAQEVLIHRYIKNVAQQFHDQIAHYIQASPNPSPTI